MKQRIPDMVVEEPLVTGWLRTEFYGDHGKAGLFIPLARMLLGQVRTIYGVNQRLAEGEPGGFYFQFQTLEDGTVLQAITNNGMDTIRIWASEDKPATRGQHDVEEKVIEMRVCGTVTDGDFTDHAVLWTSPDDVINLGYLTGGDSAQANDISDDGETVVGSATTGSGDSHAFRWSGGAEGMVDLGLLQGVGYGFSTALTVSSDGSVIAGIGTADEFGAIRSWVWTKATGMRLLPDTADGLGTPNVQDGMAISPDGKYVAGLVSVPMANNNNIQAALWEITYDTSSGDLHLQISGPQIMDPGTTSEKGSNTGPTVTTGDYFMPANVTDAGVVTGYSTHTDSFAYGVSYSNGSSGTYYADQIDTPGTVCAWSNGAFTYQGDGQTTAAAEDYPVTVGNLQRGDWTSYSYTMPEGGGSYVTISSSQYENMRVLGWALAPAPDDPEGARRQVYFGDNTQACDVSEDGTAIVGSTMQTWDLDDSGRYLAPDQPMLWLDNGDSYALPIYVAGDAATGTPAVAGVTGYASAVGFATTVDIARTENE